MDTTELENVSRHYLKRMNREAGGKKKQRRILMPIFLTGRAAGYHIADLIITTGPINRIFGSPDTVHFP
jgi:hypothetical protein